MINFSLEQWRPVNQFRHGVGIKKLYTDLSGTRIIFVDDQNQGYIFIPATEETRAIPDFPKTYSGILWDYTNPYVFIVFDKKNCYTYVYVHQSIEGKFVKKLEDSTTIISDQVPLLLYDGDLCLHGSGGILTSIILNTHSNKSSPKEQLKVYTNLRKYHEAFNLCKDLNDISEWENLGDAALNDLEINFGKVFFFCEEYFLKIVFFIYI